MRFEELTKVNVSDHIEGKNGLNYLSWTWAWNEFKKLCPDASYSIKMFDGLPYSYDEKTGYMVFTEITVDHETLLMWLPVMDSANNAMKAVPYTTTNKWGKETEVKAATMFDINKTIMRCLTKNMAMFGLGLYIYAGEDLPDDEEPETAPPAKQTKAETKSKKTDTKTYPKAGLETTAPKCENPNCGNRIFPIKKNDGNTMSIAEVVAYSKEHYKGKVYCESCMKEISKKAKEGKAK